MNRASQRLELNMEELATLLERAKASPLSEQDYHKLKAALETLGYLTQLLEDRKTTIDRLRQILFGASTEKTRNVLKTDQTTQADPDSEKSEKKNGS
jgi:transposase